MKLFFRLLLVLALFVMSCVPAAAEEPVEFSDVGSHWAGETIAQSRIYGLMSGYPGNLFMPDRSLTRVEALVVIGRGLGWDSQIDSVSTAGIKFPGDLWSGFEGYVALAANKQLINRQAIPTIKFNEPATRMEMALWLSQALQLTGNGSNLTFTDLNQIPAAQRGMLAGVVEAGILKGMPGNMFAPSKPLTRAEMATVMARLIDNGKITPRSGRQVTGTVKNIDRAGQKISLEQSGSTNTYDLDNAYMVFRQGRKAASSAVQAGERVKLSLDPSGKCVLIACQGGSPAPAPATGTGQTGVTTAPVVTGDKGYVANKYWDSFTVRLSYGAVEQIWTSSVSFIKDGAGSNYGELKRGSPVELIRSGSSITAVRILDGDRKVFGEVGQFTSLSMTIEDCDDRETSYNIKSGARVLDSDGDRIDLDDIESGQEVELTLDDSEKVKEIRIDRDSGNNLEGRVEDIDTSEDEITIEDSDGDSHTYDLADGVDVVEDGYTRSLSAVEEDMWVELRLDSDDEVTSIEILGTSVVEGEVTDIRTSGDMRIEIEESGGDEETYYLDDDVIVKEGSATRDLDDIEEGMEVKLTLDEDDRVTRIDIKDESIVEGEVTYISTSGGDRIRIEEDGDEETYYLDDDVTVKEDGSSRDLDDIEKGMVVRLTLNSSDDVTRIDILDEDEDGLSDEVAGEVTHIQTTGSDRYIEIEESDGDEEIYDLADSVTVREDGVSRSLNYVIVGMDVELDLNSRGDVIRIEINESSDKDYAWGVVTDIKPTGNQWIEIEESDGDEETYYIDDDVDVEEDGRNRDLDDIDDGMYVRLTLDDDIVTDIEIYGEDTIEGVVTDIRTSGTERIELDEDEVFYPDDDVDVYDEDGQDRDLDDIREGMEVILVLDEDEDVTLIEITGVTYVRGEVIYVRASGNERIEIEDEDGDEEIYYIDDDVTVWEGNSRRDLDDVDKDMDVKLTLDDDERVTRIEIL